MGVGGCLGSGAIQDHLVGFQLMTILTGQSHISKFWVTQTESLSSIEFPNALLPTPCQPPPSKPSPSPPVILFFLSGKKLQKWCEKNYSLEYLSKMWYLCNALIWGECIVMLTQNIYIKISVGSRRRSKLFHFSLSTLETKEENFNILFLLSKLEKCI